MNFFSILYLIVIFPIEQILEFCYCAVFEIAKNKGVCVLSLSFAVFVFTLPLYVVSESWQEKERLLQKKMAFRLQRIRRAFSGDERYMMTSEYYRQNGYHPLMALRSSLGILIQVPFFIAAYHFLSNLEPLKGASFLFINDLGSPDAAVKILRGGGVCLNVLPILMTILNCISAAIYSKGHDAKEKIQLYAMALFFLVLLYNSPSALVVYWTANNLLSLFKNIFYKIKNPKKAILILLRAASFACVLLFVFFRRKKYFCMAFFLAAIFFAAAPFFIKKAREFFSSNFKTLEKNSSLRFCCFFVCAFGIAIFLGGTIPSIIIESEAENFCYVDGYASPFVFVFCALAKAAGFFVFWPLLLYALFSLQAKKFFSIFAPAFFAVFLLNCFLFGGNYGPLYPELRFMQTNFFSVSVPAFFANAAATLAIFLAAIFLFEKKPFFVQVFSFAAAISVLTIFFAKSKSIHSSFKKMDAPNYSEKLESVFHLSKTGKNVIVLMQDGCFSPFVPFAFEECPELAQKFSGFKWYPNCISMGRLTMLGISGIFGGYDYTPFQINRDAEKTLQQKYNEALLSLQLAFSQNGFLVEVAELPYENFLEYPTRNMYLENPSLQKIGVQLERYEEKSKNSYSVKFKNCAPINHAKVEGVYTDYWHEKHRMKKRPFLSEQIFRNFIWFSFFKIAPPFMRRFVYHKDYWLSHSKFEKSSRFLDSYSVHDFLPELSDFYEDEFEGEKTKGTLLLLCNNATHESVFLEAPNYDFSSSPKNLGKSPLKNDADFSTMCGVFKRLEEFLDFLKANDCYDNTRIIVVSDHGLFKDAGNLFSETKNFPLKKGRSLATLIVKDFFAEGDFVFEKMSEENIESGAFEKKLDVAFMTNADVPHLATKDLIEGAKNPFTKNPFFVQNKNDFAIISAAPAQSTRVRHEKKYAVRDDEWYAVRDSIFEKDAWQRIDTAAKSR